MSIRVAPSLLLLALPQPPIFLPSCKNDLERRRDQNLLGGLPSVWMGQILGVSEIEGVNALSGME